MCVSAVFLGRSMRFENVPGFSSGLQERSKRFQGVFGAVLGGTRAFQGNFWRFHGVCRGAPSGFRDVPAGFRGFLERSLGFHEFSRVFQGIYL